MSHTQTHKHEQTHTTHDTPRTATHTTTHTKQSALDSDRRWRGDGAYDLPHPGGV